MGLPPNLDEPWHHYHKDDSKRGRDADAYRHGIDQIPLVMKIRAAKRPERCPGGGWSFTRRPFLIAKHEG